MLRRRFRPHDSSAQEVVQLRGQNTMLAAGSPSTTTKHADAGAIPVHLPGDDDTAKGILGAQRSNMDNYNLQRDCAGDVQIYLVCYIVSYRNINYILFCISDGVICCARGQMTAGIAYIYDRLFLPP